MSDNGDALENSGAAADSNFSEGQAGATQPSCSQKSWIDFRLVDANGNPIANVRYQLQDTQGQTQEGTTDSDGCAGEDGIDPGNCSITFLGPDSGNAAGQTS